MPLADHFREFRRRLMVSVAAVVAGAIGGWYLFTPVYDHLVEPFYNVALSRGVSLEMINLNFAGLTSAFSLRLSMSIFIGTIISSPVWLYQMWAFIVPGLTRKEKRYSLAFIAAIVPLFLAGCWFGYQNLPQVVRLLLGFTPEEAVNLPEAAMYFSFVMRFILVFGLAFLLPVVLVALNVIGILPARTLLGGWRPAVLSIFVFAAIATPTPEPFTMFLLALPLTGLFFLACATAWMLDRRRARSRPQWASDVPDDQASTL